MSKKQKTVTTNAIRMVAAAKLPYDIIEYEVEGEIGENFGENIAEKTGINKEQSFKTLVIRGEKKGIVVACIPCNHEVDLKKIAKIIGDKKADMLHVKELLDITGYVRGSVSPIGMKKRYPTFINKTALNYDWIVISGGMCGIALKIAPQNIQQITKCDFEDIVK